MTEHAKPSGTDDQGTPLLILDEPVLNLSSGAADSPDPLAALMSPLPPVYTPSELLAKLPPNEPKRNIFTPLPAPPPAGAVENAREEAAVTVRTPSAYALKTVAHHGNDPQQVKAAEMALVRHAPLEPPVQIWCRTYTDRNIEDKIRAVAAAMVAEKGYFDPELDEQSMLLYDIRFLLASHHHLIIDADSWVAEQVRPAQGDAYLYLTAANPDLAQLWLMKRLADGDIVETLSGLKPAPDFEHMVQEVLTAYMWN